MEKSLQRKGMEGEGGSLGEKEARLSKSSDLVIGLSA